ncbi:MAG: phosphate ABC transporter substrate-binding protein [Bryobacteraceae bacterium]
MKHTMIFFAAAALLFAAVRVRAADIKVIANDSVKASSVSADELKRVFLLTRNSLEDGSHAEPVLLKGGAAHEAFLREYLGKTDSALQTYYRSLVFTGKASMPRTVGSDAEVVSFVVKTKGAIGYISASAIAPGTKTLEVK